MRVRNGSFVTAFGPPLDYILIVVNPRVAPLLPDDIWQALLKINDYINTLHIDPIEQRVLQTGSKSLH
jgi:hypothetical protein